MSVSTDSISIMQEIRKIIKLPDSNKGYFTKEELLTISIYLIKQNSVIDRQEKVIAKARRLVDKIK